MATYTGLKPFLSGAPTMSEHAAACESLEKHAPDGLVFVQLETGPGRKPTAIYRREESGLPFLYEYIIQGDTWAEVEPGFMMRRLNMTDDQPLKNCTTCGHNVEGKCLVSGLSVIVAREHPNAKDCNKDFDRWVPKAEEQKHKRKMLKHEILFYAWCGFWGLIVLVAAFAR